MKRINNKCLNCSKLNADCNGMKTYFNGCLFRDNTITIESNRVKNPLFTYDLYDDLTPDATTGAEYFTVIITQWTDTTDDANEIEHKRYYFTSDDIKLVNGHTGRGKSLAISQFLWNYGNFTHLQDIFTYPENKRFLLSTQQANFTRLTVKLTNKINIRGF